MNFHPSLAAAQDAGGSSRASGWRSNSLSLSALPPADVQGAHGPWAWTSSLVRRHRLMGTSVSLGRGRAQMLPPGTQTPLWEGRGGGKDGEGWMAMVGGSH